MRVGGHGHENWCHALKFDVFAEIEWSVEGYDVSRMSVSSRYPFNLFNRPCTEERITEKVVTKCFRESTNTCKPESRGTRKMCSPAL